VDLSRQDWRNNQRVRIVTQDSDTGFGTHCTLSIDLRPHSLDLEPVKEKTPDEMPGLNRDPELRRVW
jgi:hypothetical protein